MEENTPSSAEALNPPAGDADIAQLRAVFDGNIPDVLETWLRMNNGSTAKDRRESIPGGFRVVNHPDSAIFPFGKAFLGSQEMVAHRADYLHIAADIGDKDYWEPSWIPVIETPDAPYGFLLDMKSEGDGFPILSFAEGSYPHPYAPSLAHVLDALSSAITHGAGSAFSLSGAAATAANGRIIWV
ncbi:SMI1/KNR4 family protein [Streptomyces sp. NBC_01239]|uniref:SMI1/KNR4 family protein n=1 Tax=Streptomyces sp. NBC_01239 TaxID=2903792 RepID=UPI00224F7F83|nr:SMI1/KNR4 family protein [Streptomyces sp. NBC_01239]MCX4818061.1 SMI1/KNR4 family protein [Streptomyces sp. NBC_01239]